MRKLQIFNSTLSAAIFCGLSGLTVIIVIHFLGINSRIIILPMGIALIASLLTVALKSTDKKFLKLFSTALLTYVVIFAGFLLYVMFTNQNPELFSAAFPKKIMDILKIIGYNSICAGIVCSVLALLVTILKNSFATHSLHIK